MQTEIFPDPLKIAKVTPLFKTGDLKEINNYRAISVLPSFSKILERIMHNRRYSYLINEKIYSKWFGFQKSHSTEHAIAKLTYQIYESFENSNFTFGVFIDLSKAFDTIDHVILLKSLKIMELRVQIMPGSLMIAKAIFEILHGDPFLHDCFFWFM